MHSKRLWSYCCRLYQLFRHDVIAFVSPSWAKIAEVMPGRTAKQCRERYNNHVDPAIKKDKIWTAEEDALVMQLHAEHHNQFAKIARRIPGRCYDDVKNRRVRYPRMTS